MTDAVCDNPIGLLSLEQALKRLLDQIEPVSDMDVLPLTELVGRILGVDVSATLDLPSFTNSAMDGYALRCTDGVPGAILPVAGVSLAGQPYLGPVPEGACIRIFTGAYLPPECDSVIIQELTSREGDAVRLNPVSPVRAGQNVRHQGEELKTGEKVLSAGERLSPASLGLLAALGCSHARVRRRPRVSFFSTGDELKSPGQTLACGEIYESNRPVLHALLTELGMEAIDLGVLPDERELLRATLLQAASMADAVITSGGASVGEADFVADLLRELGQVEFWKVAIKPGKPFLFGHVASTPIMGLPGNPVSMMVTFQQLVRPALIRMAGQRQSAPIRLWAKTFNALKKKPGRQEFQRAVWEIRNGELFVTGLNAQGSHLLTTMQLANCFIVLPPESSGVNAGETVEIEPFGCLYPSTKCVYGVGS